MKIGRTPHTIELRELGGYAVRHIPILNGGELFAYIANANVDGSAGMDKWDGRYEWLGRVPSVDRLGRIFRILPDSVGSDRPDVGDRSADMIGSL